MPPIAACADPARIHVTKIIAGDPFNLSTGGQEVTLVDGDPVTFAITVKNTGGESAQVDIVDVFPSVFTGVTWTRTGQTGTVTTGSGNISNLNQVLASGQQITYLAEATYEPEACTSITVNVVTATLDGEDPVPCCGPTRITAWAKVTNGTPGAPKAKIDPTKGITALELLTYLVEGTDIVDKVKIANFVNECNTFADVIDGLGGGTADGVAVAILDAFGDPTGLYGETTPGS
jgi:hypothetical protein